MSKERELLERVMYMIPSSLISEHDLDLVDDIKELLAQPEQSSTTRHALDSYWNQEAYQRGYAEAKLKLKRKPITGIEISNGFKADDEAKHPYSYWAGVEFAEKHHGIGGEE